MSENMNAAISALGITKEDVIEKIAESWSWDKDYSSTEVRNRVDAQIKESVASIIQNEIEKQMGEGIEGWLKSLKFQETSSWGEPKGPSQTLQEYVESRINAHLNEPVNSDGKPRTSDSYMWKEAGKRIDYLLVGNIEYQVRALVKKILADPFQAMQEKLKDAMNKEAGMLANKVKEALK